MATSTYDAIVIGTGQAGPFVATRFAKAGMKVAIVERGLFGGTCVNIGCIPTKTMVASAYAAHIARHAADFGVGIGGAVTIDMARVKARKDAISGQSRSGVEAGLSRTGRRRQPRIQRARLAQCRWRRGCMRRSPVDIATSCSASAGREARDSGDGETPEAWAIHREALQSVTRIDR